MDDGRRDDWEKGATAYFEYHCLRTHDSSDADLWYRSHRKVEVLSIEEPGIGATLAIRRDDGEVRTYLVRFEDGREAGAFEDELIDGIEHLAPDMGPPPPSEIVRAGGTPPPPAPTG